MAAMSSKTSTWGIRPLKIVSEAVRERETFKYEPFLFTDYRFIHSGQQVPSSELSTSSDSVLTALAQLGTYQTGTERSFISLFDKSHQYIIAEATPSIPLTPGLPSDNCPVPLLLCGIAVSRNQGTCEHVLYAGPNPGSDQCRDLPLSLVRDLAKDPRFSSKLYCQLGGSCQFYAAVPVRTRKGINIGVYCVLSSTPPDAWDGQCTRRLREISHAIMGHLESNRSKHSYRRNERMIRGLGSFIEGRSTISSWQSRPNAAAFIDNAKYEGALDATQQHLERQEEDIEDEPEPLQRQAAGLTNRGFGSSSSRPTKRPNAAPEADLFGFLPKANVHRSVGPPTNSSDSVQIEETNSSENVPSRIFSKAANIIREAFEVEGCLFFDVTLGSYKAQRDLSPTRESHVHGVAGQPSSASSSDEQFPVSPAEAPDSSCGLLGFSTTEASSINCAEVNRSDGIMPKRFLAKLLQRYPNGRTFNFDTVGELESSDSSEDVGARISPVIGDVSSTHESIDVGDPGATQGKHDDKPFSRLKEGALIQQAFPSARSVAFTPIWDSKRERWFAGGFTYTLSPTRVFTIEGELSFLEAFARLAASEILNLETLQADKAKSVALGSLSHELRSPLHGAMLSTELLNDTDLSVFQGNATHTIETCCRTLLDTIDHLLDYSKVNSFAVKRKQEANSTPSNLPVRAISDQFGKKTLSSNTRLDGLIEDVAESIFAGFNFQRMSIRQLSKQDDPTHADTVAHNRLDFAQAMEQLAPGLASEGEQGSLFGDVSIYLSIDPTCNWMFNFPAGAVRRIIMNLFGNALKYTTRGTIKISLNQEISITKRSRMERIVKLIVQDTGKGIGEDYLRHKLFTPFSQEDELASGTGLGLSLVKRITSQLRGQISVESQVGVGSTITVKLPLEQPSAAFEAPLDFPEDDREFTEQVRQLKGLRIRLSGFDYPGRRTIGVDGRTIVEEICRCWLQMDIVSDQQTQQMTPDIVLWSDDVLPESFEQIAQLAETPNIVVCQDALMAYQRFTKYELAEQGAIFEFISQPIGPRKFARSILLAYKQWMGLRKFPSRPRSAESKRPGSLYASRLAAASSTHAKLPPPASSTKIVGSQSRTSDIAKFVHRPRIRAVESPAFSAIEMPLDPMDRTFTTKILLVDDNRINLMVLSAYMRKLGQAYEAVTNGKEAVGAYMQNPAQFVGILMDISMPVMDGLEATRYIRAYEHKNELPAVTILALTGLASDSVHQEALESGVDIFLTKPVKLKGLLEVLESMDIISP